MSNIHDRSSPGKTAGPMKERARGRFLDPVALLPAFHGWVEAINGGHLDDALHIRAELADMGVAIDWRQPRPCRGRGPA
jgi:hypothetical protein